MENFVAPELLFTIGLLLGAILRTLLPWLKKKAADPSIAFDPKFVWTAFLAIILAMIEMAAIVAGAPDQFAVLDLRFAFFGGFFFGLGNNELVNRILHSGKTK